MHIELCSADAEIDGYLMGLMPGLHVQRAHQVVAQYHGQVRRQIPRIDVWWVEIDESAKEALAKHPAIRWVEPNQKVHAADVTPNDDFYLAQQWNLRLMDLPEAWVFTQKPAPVIAIVDDGVSLGHPDLSEKIWVNVDEVPDNNVDDDHNGYVDDVHGWNFVLNRPNPVISNHGSHVAGIAGAASNNGIGIAGVAWASALMPVQVLQGGGYRATTAEGIIYAADNGAQIINLSLGDHEFSHVIAEAVAYAQSRGCLLVAAAGNDYVAVEYPAALPGVLAVAASTAADIPASRSNQGPEVDVTAPGVDIYSTSTYGYAFMSGTSMATPHVSGLAALLWALEPDMTAGQVAHVITRTAQDIYTVGWDPRAGWGRVAASEAVLDLIDPQLTLSAFPAATLVGVGSTMLVAEVTYDQGQSVPDGLTVHFGAETGSFDPARAMTYDGVAMTAFYASSTWGAVTLFAEVGARWRATMSLDIVPYQLYLPMCLDISVKRFPVR